jgi:glycerol-3-phosphate dehydrogenase
MFKQVVKRGLLPVGAAASAFLAYDHLSERKKAPLVVEPWTRPVPAQPLKRSELLNRLGNDEYDMVVVGGGATGTGVALDAVSRGLKVALIERDDFGSCTSSRSTKLVHGGVRYLEKAVWQLDYGQYLLVKEALAERKAFLDMAPHLAFPLPIMIPLYKWWQLPYYWAGVKAYDALAGRANLESSYMLTRGRALQAFPMLNDADLKGAVVYYDGSHNDSRTNVSLALTAAELGATVLNHVEVTDLTKDGTGQIQGVVAHDVETGEVVRVKAKSVVNATGPFCDAIRAMDSQATRPIVVPSVGVHIVLPGYFSPSNMGLLDPATSDGRVIFFLPWQGMTLAGTTDSPCSIETNPVPRKEDINFVLNEVSNYVGGKINVHAEDVRAAWAGVRPLVKDPDHNDKGGTENVVRSHLVSVSPSGLVTVAGGKWTTFREMAEETVDKCVSTFNLQPSISRKSVTRQAKLVGAEGWTPLRYVELAQRYNLLPEVARHLSENYGTRAFTVAELCKVTGTPSSPVRDSRISAKYPFVDGELLYAVRYEYARTAVDFLARRTRLAFLDCQAAYEALPSVIDIMAEELNWSKARKDKEFIDSVEFLHGMGLGLIPRPALANDPVTPPATTIS